MSSIRQTLRKRVAPVAFLAVLAFFAVHTCQSELSEVELRFDLGAHADDVRAFRVDVLRADDDTSVATLERPTMGRAGGPPLTMALQLAKGSYRLLFEVTRPDGVRRFERVIETADQATITVQLERELAPR